MKRLAKNRPLRIKKLGIVMHAYNPNTLEADAERSQVHGQTDHTT
jgi:hypothetical protein